MRLSEPAHLSWNRYKAKISILLLLYLLSPSPPSPIDPIPSNIDSIPSQPTPKEQRILEPGSTRKEESGKGDTVEIFWTPPYDGDSERDKVKGLGELKTKPTSTNLAVKGSTRAGETIKSPLTPALSVPPSSEPTGNKREERVEIKRSAISTTDSNYDQDSPPPSTGASAIDSPLLNPLTYTLILLHFFYLVQYFFESTKSFFSQSLLSNPLPPPFKIPSSTLPSSSSRSTRTSFSKISKKWTRFRWRFNLVSDRCRMGLIKHAILSGFVLALIGLETIYSFEGGSARRGVWNRVLFEKGSGELVGMREFANTDLRDTTSWLRPYRDVALLELLTTLVIAINSLSPILLSLSLLPPTLLAPRRFLPRSSSPLYVPTPYILPYYLSFTLHLLILISTLVLFPSRPSLSTTGIFTLPTFLFFYTFSTNIGGLLSTRERLEGDLEKISFLITKFEKSRIFKSKKRFQGEGELEEEEEEGKRELVLEELERESCCICFEEDWEEEEEEGKADARRRSFRSRCFLTNCGHQVHAVCLYEWFKKQSFCPACHDKIPSLSRFPPDVASSQLAEFED
ncbi:hypothetical protein JCM16303_006423 [Sporobolomyces ruberrimus]